MNKKIKIESFIERLNNMDFEQGTKFKFLDKVYLYDYPNLVGIYEIGKPTKPEYSIFAQLDMTNLHCEIEIIEEQEQEIDIQSYKELLLNQLKEREHTNADIYMLGIQINALIRAVKQIDSQIKKRR